MRPGGTATSTSPVATLKTRPETSHSAGKAGVARSKGVRSAGKTGLGANYELLGLSPAFPAAMLRSPHGIANENVHPGPSFGVAHMRP
jgi:hypothetical protein